MNVHTIHRATALLALTAAFLCLPLPAAMTIPFTAPRTAPASARLADVAAYLASLAGADDTALPQLAAAGLLDRLQDTTPDTICTVGDYLQLLHNLDRRLRFDQVTVVDLRRTLTAVKDAVPQLNTHEAFADVDTTHPRGLAVYTALANGWYCGRSASVFGANDPLTPALAQTIAVRFTSGGPAPLPDAALPQTLTILWSQAATGLARSAALHAYKTASLSLADSAMPPELKTALQAAIAAIRQEHLPPLPRTNVTGSPDQPDTWIFREGNQRPFMREYHLASLKPNTPPVEIVQITDTHYNLVNAQDRTEANPSVMSTLRYRLWLRNGSSAPAIRNCFNVARFSDQTIVTGDVLDYLSWGCRQLTIENLFRPDTDLLACLGGHDTTRVMQGKVPDPTPLDSRRAFLQEFWPHDIFYTSRVLKDKVLCIVMDNGTGGYLPGQADKLTADLKRARAHNWIVLVFQHEPLATRNPQENDLPPLRRNDPANWNYAARAVGGTAYWSGKHAPTQAVCQALTSHADIVRGVFCGHMHSDYYTEIIGTATDAAGQTVPRNIPQIVSTGSIYDGIGHIVRIIVD